MKVLIVDDSKAMRALLQFYVSELQLETTLAEDGCNALEVLGREPDVKLALVDWDMPRMNGLEFVRAVRTRQDYSGIKLMMVTTQNSMEKVNSALSAGADDFLMKPISRESLEGKLRMLGAIE